MLPSLNLKREKEFLARLPAKSDRDEIHGLDVA
jgi:hypothetical protein